MLNMAVAGCEGQTDATEGNANFCRHSRFVGADHPSSITPWQETRIPVNIGHKLVHFLWAVPDEDGLGYGFHRMAVCAGL
jgi:hypothetical protein